MKKKVALSATAIAVLASTVPTHVAPVEAEELADVVYVDFSKASGNDDDKGTGVVGNEYTQLTTALEKVKPGGTIIITGKAFVNDTGSNDAPFIIDKEVTIKSEGDTPAVMDIRAGGIVLGANVKFENVSLQLVNINRHDIFANGYKLELVNVATLGPGIELFDIYVGSLVADGVDVPAGSKGQVFIKTDGNLKGASNLAKFGTIYAGSMGADYTKLSNIEVENAGFADTISIENIVGTGSLKSDGTGYYNVSSRVGTTLKNYFPKVDGGAGSSSSFLLYTTTSSTRDLNVSNIDYLRVVEGQTNINNPDLTSLREVTVDSNAVLDLTGAAKDFTIENYGGSGTLVFPTEGQLHITKSFEGSLKVKPQSPLSLRELGKTYITTTTGANVTFVDETGLYLTLEPTEEDGTLNWKLAESPDKPTLPTITKFSISDVDKNIKMNVSDFSTPQVITYPFTLTTVEYLEGYDLVFLEDYDNLEVKVAGHIVEYTEDENDVSCFYVEALDMYIYLQPTDEDDLSLQEMTIEFKKDGNYVTPKADTYDFNITLGEATLDATLYVEGGGTQQPTQPPSQGGSGSGSTSSGGSTDTGTTGGSSSGGTTNTPSTEGTTGGSNTGLSTGDNTGGSATATTPPSTGGGTTPPPSTGDNTGSTTTPTTPPSTDTGTTGGGSTGGTTNTPSTGGSTSGGITTPPTPTPVPPTPEVEDKVNGVENFKDLDKEIQEKVDSLITDVQLSENGLVLDLDGDEDDLSHASSLEITVDGIFVTVDGEKVKFNTELDLTDIDWDNTRVLRVGGGAVPHKNLGDGIKITSSNFHNLYIGPKEEEPFTDINDDDWFKEDVEEMFNYGFTKGTTATTYSPNESITRAEFAVMLARVFELQLTSETSNLGDLKGKWYADEAQALYDAGIIKGFNDGTFGGDKHLTRQQAMTMLTRMLEYVGVDTKPTKDVHFKDVDKISVEAQGAVKFLASMGVLNNGDDVNFNPYNNLTRAQMAKIVVKSVHLTDLY